MPRNKYNVASKADRTADGIVFASKAEMLRYADLQMMEKAGVIRRLRRQVAYPLERGGIVILTSKGRVAKYTPDFVYEERDGKIWREIIEDVKGAKTRESELRIAVFEALYSRRVKITRKIKGGRFLMEEDIKFLGN